MANPNQGRKLMVRTALVTGATVASLMGAQSLAFLDNAALAAPETDPAAKPVAAEAAVEGAPAVAKVAPSLSIQRAAPSIIILRRPGQTQPPSSAKSVARPAAPKSAVIQPPMPAQISAPAPVIVSQPAPVTTRSSR